MWYVAKTKPAKEQWLDSYLTNKLGVEVFLPTVRLQAGSKAKWEPLFPTYLFCVVDLQSSDWPAIRGAPGLSYFLGTGQGPVPVSDELIAHLKQRVSWWNDGGHVHSFAPGERVMVSSGPFSGLEGIFQRYVPARQRCQLLLEILGRLTRVELPVEVIKAEAPYRGMAMANCGAGVSR